VQGSGAEIENELNAFLSNDASCHANLPKYLKEFKEGIISTGAL
jgi:hypothetical protein